MGDAQCLGVTGQPNGAAPVIEAAPPNCLHCKRRRAMQDGHFTLVGVGTFRGPICEWCREEATLPDSKIESAWSPGEEPHENPRRWRMGADRAGDILSKVMAWTPAKPDLQFKDLFQVAMLLRGWIINDDSRLPGADNGTLLWRIGLGRLPRNQREREKVLGNSASAALRAVVIEECIIASGYRVEEFAVLEPVDKSKAKPAEPEEAADRVDEMVLRWEKIADEMLDIDAWPENEDSQRMRDFAILAGQIANRLTAIEKGSKGRDIVGRTRELIDDRAAMRSPNG